MRILLVEDRGSVSFYLEEALKLRGHVVFEAHNIYDARYYWENEDIDCIIADLNMSPEGLTDEEIKQTDGGVLTGWVWLQNYVFPKCKEMKSRTLIYTEYLTHLREATSGNEGILKNIVLISKRGSTSPAERLLECVDGIEHMIQKTK